MASKERECEKRESRQEILKSPRPCFISDLLYISESVNIIINITKIIVTINIAVSMFYACNCTTPVENLFEIKFVPLIKNSIASGTCTLRELGQTSAQLSQLIYALLHTQLSRKNSNVYIPVLINLLLAHVQGPVLVKFQSPGHRAV